MKELKSQLFRWGKLYMLVPMGFRSYEIRSKDSTNIVSTKGMTCTCKAFRYSSKKKCKHLYMVRGIYGWNN